MTTQEHTTPKEYVLDATAQKLGRLSSEIASILIGKKDPEYAPNKVVNARVIVRNASKLSIDQAKRNEKMYYHHTGYPGGDRHTPLKRILEKEGYEGVIRRAVKGMLPKNKLQKHRLMLLTIEE
jgi:large subunit ribosomal protein L13